MVLRRISILLLVFLFTSFGLIHLASSSSIQKSFASPSYIINLDSLRSLIVTAGWNSSFIDVYQHALLNFPIDLENESEKINNLPGNFEKIFLQAVIQKRNGDFKNMFDSLLTGFDYPITYLPYFDEMVLAAKSSGQTSFIENLLQNSPKLSQVQAAYFQGVLSSYNADYEEALTLFLKADSLESKNKNILLNLAQVYKSLGDYKSAGEILSGTKKHFVNDDILKPKILLTEGTLLYLSNDFQAAELLYQKALDASKKIEDKISKSRSLTDLGICADVNGQIDLARKYFSQALAASKQVNDIDGLAFANSELGVSFTFTNELIDAKKHYLAGYDMYKKLGNSVRLALLSNNLGKLYMNFFDYKSAKKYFEEGIQFAGDDKRAQAMNLLGLADVNANLSNYTKALNYYREVQKISAEIKDVVLNTDVNSGLGALNFNLGRFSNASLYYNYALELQNNSSNKYLSADIYHKLGLTYFGMDSLKIAEEYFKESIKATVSSKNDYALALSFSDLADLYLTKKDFTNCKIYLAKANSLAKKNDWEHLFAEQQIIEAAVNEAGNEFKKAQTNYRAALKIAGNLNDANLQILVYNSLGKLFYKQRFLEAAESYFKSGISLVEDVSRPLFEDSETQIAYFNTKRELYDSYASLLLDQKRYEQAFLIIDKSRSRNTMQNLLNLKLASFTNDNKSIEKLYELDWMVNSGIYTVNEQDSLKRLFTDVKKILAEKYPSLKRIIDPGYENKISGIQSTLHEKENLLSIYLTGTKSYLFLITKNDFRTFEINASEKEILKIVSNISPHFDLEARKRYFFNKDLFAFNSKYAYEFYNIMLKPSLEKIPKNEKLIISPSKELLAFPFEFLVTQYDGNESDFDYSRKKFLISEYSVSYTTSAALFAEEVKNNLPNDDKILIVGDPAIDNNSDEFAERRSLLEESVGTPRSLTLLPLKYSAEEVNMIKSIIRTDKLFVSKDATETNFKQHAELSRIIHLSTHSLLYKKQPLIFFSNFYDPENDGFLEASEIVQMNLNSDLVVLSSCSSGLGRLDESEGILGMTKAFFDAGSKSVVVSLWEVNDKYTSKLMTIFYQKLSEGFDKSEALRQAKLEFINKYSSNPYFWASFVLSGNTSKIRLEPLSRISAPVLISLTAVLIILLTYLYRRRTKKLNRINNPA